MEQLRQILLYVMAMSGLGFILFGTVMIWGNFNDGTVLKMALTCIVFGIGSSLLRWGLPKE